jgi:hypothetical protein
MRHNGGMPPLDTTAEAEAVQIEIYRRMGGSGRLAAMYRLNEIMRATAKAGIRSRHPEYDDETVHRAYARLVLGDELVRQVWPDQPLVKP